MFTSSLIQKAYQLTNRSDAKGKLRHDYEEEVNQLLLFNKKHKGRHLLTPLNFYLAVLDNANPVFFPYMNEEQKNSLARELQVTCLFLLAEKKYEMEHQKTEHIKEYDDQIKRCQELLDELLYQKHCQEEELTAAPEHGYASTDQPVAYLGIIAGTAFSKKMVAMTDRKTKTIREQVDWVNEKRLYWVWTSGFLKTMLGLLPANFFNAKQAQKTAGYPDPYTGVMSWGLYYFRFALNLGLLLKHTLRGPWMSKEEKNEGWVERFQTQWEQRKFTLLNDLIWATGNLLCFFWLVGKGAAGAWGDMLTLGLLIFDISLCVWDFEEQRVRYNKQMYDFDEGIKKLNAQIKELNNSTKSTTEETKKQLIDLELQRTRLEKSKNQCAREWRYQKLQLATNIAYAVGLMTAFVLLAAPFFPLPAATLAAMSISGAVLCFAFSVICNAIKGGIEIHKTKMSIKELKAEQEQKLQQFKELTLYGADDNAKKLLFLELKKLQADTNYQEQIITYQTLSLMRTIIMSSIIPVVAFVSFVFLPLGLGIGMLAAAIALAAVSHYVINALFKAEKTEIKEFDEQEYLSFCDDPKSWSNKSASSPRFFQPEKEQPLTIEAQTQLDSTAEENKSLLVGNHPS